MRAKDSIKVEVKEGRYVINVKDLCLEAIFDLGQEKEMADFIYYLSNIL